MCVLQLDKYILCRIYKKTDGVRARLRPREPTAAENDDEVLDDGPEAHSELGPTIPTGHINCFGLMENPNFLESIVPGFQMGTNPLIYSGLNMSTFNRHQ